MDSQIDHAVGMPIGLLDELPPPVDATESLFCVPQEPLAQGNPFRSLLDLPLPQGLLKEILGKQT